MDRWQTLSGHDGFETKSLTPISRSYLFTELFGLDPLSKTRTEADFKTHIEQTFAQDPQGEWVFVVDQLNTHKSESLVRWVAHVCDIQDELGEKGKSGILKSMKTRADFLIDESHRVRFVYTPVHASWLNQIECWFSILVRRLLKRASFTSIQDLQQRILDFIDFFNKTMAKPFKWTYNRQTP